MGVSGKDLRTCRGGASVKEGRRRMGRRGRSGLPQDLQGKECKRRENSWDMKRATSELMGGMTSGVKKVI